MHFIRGKNLAQSVTLAVIAFTKQRIIAWARAEAGSSYLPSELNAAYFYAQLEAAGEINDNKITS